MKWFQYSIAQVGEGWAKMLGNQTPEGSFK